MAITDQQTPQGRANRTEDEEIELRGKTIAWAGVVIGPDSADAEVVLRFTDGTSAKVEAWQREGYPVEMVVYAQNT